MLEWVEDPTRGLFPVGVSELRVRMDERHRLSRELHDGTSQFLVALQLNIMALKQQLQEPHYAAVLDEIDNTIATLHEEVRTIAASNPKPAFTCGDLPSALKSMAESFGRLGQLDVTVDVAEDFAPQPTEVETALFRITQEALANARRHGLASLVRIWLSSNGSRSSLTIQDNGIGLRLTENPGAGLSNIRDRVAELGGTFSITRLASGTRLDVSMVGNPSSRNERTR